MTLLGLYLKACGLSRDAAADMLSMSAETLKKASQGKFRINDGVMAELAGLIHRILDGADQELDRLDGRPTPYEVLVAGDDAAARAMGWPSAGPHQAMVALVVGELPVDQVRLVTLRGATLDRVVEECRALNDPSVLRAQSMRDRHKDPAFKMRVRRAPMTPEERAAQSERMKTLHADPAFKERQREGLRKSWRERKEES